MNIIKCFFLFSSVLLTTSIYADLGFDYKIVYKSPVNVNLQTQVAPKTVDILNSIQKKGLLYNNIYTELSDMSKKEIVDNIVKILAKGIIFAIRGLSPDVFGLHYDMNDTTRALFFISLLDYPVHDIQCETYVDHSGFKNRGDSLDARFFMVSKIGKYPQSSKMIIRYAIEHLIHTVDVSILTKYSSYIKEKLNNGEWVNPDSDKRLFSESNKYQLLSLTSLSDQEKKDFLKKKKVPTATLR